MNPGSLTREPHPLANRRVLFLPKNSRTPYFAALLAAARREFGWQVAVVGPARHAAAWREAADSLTEPPEFSAPQSWESDKVRCAAVDAFIAACESATGTSAGRIILAGERDLGRGFSRGNFHWFHNKMARRVLQDTAEPARIVRRIFAFAKETLEKTRPDLVLAGEWADPLCFAFSLAAREMGIPCVVNRQSKLWSGRCYWSADPLMYNEAARERATMLRAATAPVQERSKQHIAEFRSRPKTLGYVQHNWNAIDRRGWLFEHIDFARLLAAQLRYHIAGRSGPTPKPALRVLGGFYRRSYLRLRQVRLFRRISEEELAKKRYIYVAMHKDPEQALNYQAPFWSNQYSTVSLLAGLLPDGFSLLVREHRNNRGRRPTRYYKDLRRLPGVVLIDGLDDQFKYIRNAELVVSENGTSGWEGLLLSRRVIVLDRCFYSAAGLARHVTEPGALAEIVLEMLRQPPTPDARQHDLNLGWILDAEWQTSVPVDEPTSAANFDLLAAVLHKPAMGRRETIAVSA
ncbi:MAG TPA: hypothetical protein VFA53_06400 [Xanthobacteraceae bacterium]|nr:hypothetical protein [Xanthobacteraceae bacterium]